MAVIDAFTYNGETEMLKLHVAALAPYVDHFFVVESKTTFSGQIKPLYFKSDSHHVEKWLHKITYHIVNDEDSEYWDMARKSPNTVGAKHWQREFIQKESIRDALKYLEDDDMVYIGDVDELWDPLYTPQNALEKLQMRVYAYYMDYRSDEEFWGTLTGKWKDIKGKCLNHLRSDVSLRNSTYSGWHFTSQGGIKELKRKLNDSYSEEDYNSWSIQHDLSQRYFQGKDFLGRDFKFEVNESEWPPYLVKHRKEYAHLCKAVSPLTSRRKTPLRESF